MKDNTTSRIESELEVRSYIQNLRYALKNGAKIEFQVKRELLLLTVEDYIQTVKDHRFPKRSEMREFGKVYNGTEDVYIKIRVEVLNIFGNTTTFVMSFHYAERPFIADMFPYKNR